jgi:hypothetical protein
MLSSKNAFTISISFGRDSNVMPQHAFVNGIVSFFTKSHQCFAIFLELLLVDVDFLDQLL